MLIKMLFPAYRDARNAKEFGSRFMNLLGRVFMGSPESKGLGHVMPALRDTYYYCKHDRLIPPGEVEQWFKDSILVSEYRQLEHREISKATRLAVSLYAVLAVVLVAMLPGTSSTSTGGALPNLTGGANAQTTAENLTQRECQIARNTLALPMRLSHMDLGDLLAQCDANFPQ